jgi:hypothetical protein
MYPVGMFLDLHIFKSILIACTISLIILYIAVIKLSSSSNEERWAWTHGQSRFKQPREVFISFNGNSAGQIMRDQNK